MALTSAERIIRVRGTHYQRMYLGLCFSLLIMAGSTAITRGETPVAHQLFLPLIQIPSSQLLIAAAHIDSALSGEADEAVLLWNVGQRAQPLAGWQLQAGSRRATFPITATLILNPGERIWCAAEAQAFYTSFGHWPGCEWRSDSRPDVLDLMGSLTLGNQGGTLLLLSSQGRPVDVLLYGDQDQPQSGWSGPPAQLYDRGAVGRIGQIWQRKRDPLTHQPLDSDRATDWAGDLADLVWGRQVRYPGWLGWDAQDLALPLVGTAQTQVTVAVGPEGLYQPIADAFQHAQQSIQISGYTFEHSQLAHILADRARQGVRVQILLEGGPTGGIDDLQKWCVEQIVQAGGEVAYHAVRDDAPRGYRTRYRYLHAKTVLIDEHLALVGTENFGPESMPVPQAGERDPDGRRGFYLMTDAPAVVQGLQQIFAADWGPHPFLDIRPFEPGHPIYGGPITDPFAQPIEPPYATGSPFAEPVTFSGLAHFQLVSAPENSLRPDTGLLHLFQQAGAGDEIYMVQMYEQKQWGESDSNPIADPNPRLQAVIAAAQRGARVRLLLDTFFDDPDSLRSNQQTAHYLHTLANATGLDLQVRLGNPTGQGIHAKIVMVRLGEVRWSAVGSLNGGEVSHKINREIVLITDMTGVYDRLQAVFEWDWNRPPVEVDPHALVGVDPRVHP